MSVTNPSVNPSPGTPFAPAIMVHGGAGEWARAEHADAVGGCEAAARVGLDRLAAGASALQAVIAAVRVLEDNPIYNAGIGSVLTRNETIETDASVMDGATLGFGAVAAVPNGYPAVDLARLVLDDGEHILLCGAQVWELARERGLAPPDPALLVTNKAREKLRRELQQRTSGGLAPVAPGTVGAVAIDAHGHVAVATSTGGTTYKRAGRIGDTPLPGCGSYADRYGGAASATGHGESIARVTMARVCTDRMRDGASASMAAWHAVNALTDVTGTGGIIACDLSGRLGAAHNTAVMPHAGGRLGGQVAGSMISRPGDGDVRLG